MRRSGLIPAPYVDNWEKVLEALRPLAQRADEIEGTMPGNRSDEGVLIGGGLTLGHARKARALLREMDGESGEGDRG